MAQSKLFRSFAIYPLLPSIRRPLTERLDLLVRELLYKTNAHREYLNKNPFNPHPTCLQGKCTEGIAKFLFEQKEVLLCKWYECFAGVYLKHRSGDYDIKGRRDRANDWITLEFTCSDPNAITVFRTFVYQLLENKFGPVVGANCTKHHTFETHENNVKQFGIQYASGETLLIPDYYYGIGVIRWHISLCRLWYLSDKLAKSSNEVILEEVRKAVRGVTTSVNIIDISLPQEIVISI